MRATILAITAAAGVAATAGGAAAQPGGQSLGRDFSAGVRVDHAAARMIVIPERRAIVSVTIQGGDARLPRLDVRTEGGVVVVDGGLNRRIGGCGGYGVVTGFGPRRDATMRVMIRGIGPLALERLPVITARVPLDASVSAGEAVWGEVGPMNSLAFANRGCGDWTLADVRGPLAIAVAGSGDTRAGSAGSARASVSGSGDISLREVGAMDVTVAGSGDVRAMSVNGALSARIVGSGDVTVDGGRASSVAASIAGSGDFRFGGEAGAVAARIAGSGDIRVAHATGPVSKSVAGSGDVSIGR